MSLCWYSGTWEGDNNYVCAGIVGQEREGIYIYIYSVSLRWDSGTREGQERCVSVLGKWDWGGKE